MDKTVEDGEQLSLGRITLKFIETPGHTMGSLCILLEESGSLFTGDTVLGTGSVAISPDHKVIVHRDAWGYRKEFYRQFLVVPSHYL